MTWWPSFLLALLVSCGQGEARLPNVLLILADDLRPALGCYGDDGTRNAFHSPHLDRLARSAIRSIPS